MNRQRFVLLLIAALVVLTTGWYVATRRDEPSMSEGAALYPQLAADMASITAVDIRKGSATPTVSVHANGGRWTVAERADYPADVTKLRKLLTALGEAKIIEEKTSDPARYASIGVADPTRPESLGAEVTVTGPIKAAVIVGKSVGQGTFVRRAGEPQSFSVEPAISLETEPRFWIDSRLLDVPTPLIQDIQFEPAEGARYAIHRVKPTDDAFSLDGAPADRQALDAHALAPSPTLLANLTAEDVAPVAAVPVGPAMRVVITLNNGGTLTLVGMVDGGKHWLQLTAGKDVQLTTKTAGRAFEIASYRYDAIFKPLEQLLVRQPASKPTKAAAAP